MDSKNLRQIDILNLAKPFCVAQNVKLGKNDLSQYVSGKVQPKDDKLHILSQALSVTELWLRGYDVPMEDLEKRNDPVNDPVYLRKNRRKNGKRYLKYALSYLFGMFLGLFACQLSFKAALFFYCGCLCLAIRLLLEN